MNGNDTVLHRVGRLYDSWYISADFLHLRASCQQAEVWDVRRGSPRWDGGEVRSEGGPFQNHLVEISQSM